MTRADEWRGYVTELLEVAERTADAERRRRLFALAEQWKGFAQELGALEGSEEAHSQQSARAEDAGWRS